MRPAITLFLFVSIHSVSTAQQVKITDEKLISQSVQYPLNEAHLITDPVNSNHLLSAAILTKEWKEGSNAESYILLFQSWDAGKNWTSTHFNKGIVRGADPWLSMNNKGTVVLSSLNSFAGNSKSYLVVFISRNAGKTWDEQPVNLGSGHDRQSIVVDPLLQDFIIVSGKYGRNADHQLIFGLMVSRLTATGDFKEANWHALSNLDKNNGTPLITRDRTLIIPYVDYLHNNKQLATRRNWIIKSKDYGRTFSEPILLSEGGQFPSLLLDSFSVSPDVIHYLIGDANSANPGYTVSSSKDQGYTWSKPVDVDQYTGKNPFVKDAQWEINSKGIIGVFWFDKRDNPDTSSHNLYFSYSADRGQTFKSPVRVSSASSTPNARRNGPVDKRWPTGGDYFGLNPTSDNGFRVVWADHRNGKPQLFHALVHITN